MVKGEAFIRSRRGPTASARTGERAFGLEHGAPPPPAITPLGEVPDAVPTKPVEAWLELLFGP